MTQERRRGEEPSFPFTPVPLARLNIMMVTSACCTVCETARGHSKNHTKSGYHCNKLTILITTFGGFHETNQIVL